MANNSEENSVDELRRRLLMAKDAGTRLAAYIHYLPTIIGESPAEAILFANDAEKAARELPDWGVFVEIIHLRARAHMLLNDPVTALKDLRFALGYIDDHTDIETRAKTLIRIGEAAIRTDDPRSALDPLQKALELCKDPTSLRAEALEALGELHTTTAHFDEAIEVLHDALTIRRELNEQAGIGRVLCAIAKAYGRMEDLVTAELHYRQSLDEFRAAGDITSEIGVLANLASIHTTRGELDAAMELIWKAYAACETFEDRATLTSLAIHIADIHNQRGESDIALKYYLRAYESLQGHPPDDLLLGLYSRIGRLYDEANDRYGALHVYRLAINIATTLNKRQLCSELHRSIAGVYEKLNDHQYALKHHKEYARIQIELSREEQQKKIADVTTEFDRAQMEQELENGRDYARQLEESIELKNRELIERNHELITVRSDLTSEKNKVKEITAIVEAAGDNEAVRKIRKVLKKHADKLNTARGETWVAAKAAADQEWERVRIQFEIAHPKFVERLLELCPTLTPTQVKLCILTKHYDGDPKKIARVLNNTDRTLQTQRFKILQKLKLDVPFTTFINTLSTS
jgi:tetratricopeptide (TPR) repeat protein